MRANSSRMPLQTMAQHGTATLTMLAPLLFNQPQHGLQSKATMFSHVMVGVSDLEASRKFYDAALGAIGIGPGVANKSRYFYRSPTGTFGITTPINGESACHGNGSTIGFNVDSPEQGAAFHAAGVANGGTTCEDPPGVRNSPTGNMYLAYLRDPDGNKICVLHRLPRE